MYFFYWHGGFLVRATRPSRLLQPYKRLCRLPRAYIYIYISDWWRAILNQLNATHYLQPSLHIIIFLFHAHRNHNAMMRFAILPNNYPLQLTPQPHSHCACVRLQSHAYPFGRSPTLPGHRNLNNCNRPQFVRAYPIEEGQPPRGQPSNACSFAVRRL